MKFKAHAVRGLGEAKALGFPTINLAIPDLPEKFQHGVYAAKFSFRGCNDARAVLYFGPRFGHKSSITCEVHCIDKNKFAASPKTGDPLTIELGGKIREVEFFRSRKMLKARIMHDIKMAHDLTQ